MTRGFWSVGVGILACSFGCSSNDATVTNTYTGAGGAATTGGASTAGGTPTGGTSSESLSETGGVANVGGTANSGGSSVAGGATSTTSTTNTGGTTTSGGTSNTGGSSTTNTGGTSTTETGGSSPTGGSSNNATTGGSSGTNTGGAETGGQSTTTGGSGAGGQTTTPPSATAQFPFPQNRRDTSCIYPTNADFNDVQKVYDQWKQHLVTSDGVGANCTSCLRVKRVAEPGLQKDSTVSEGIGYGMIIAVYMDDQTLFDGLWRYEQAHTATAQGAGFPPSSIATSLMNWYIAADGNTATTDNGGQSGSGAATDADEDMAWGLVMADKQWGGKGSLTDTYANYAKKLISDIWTYEIYNGNTVKNGNGWGDDNCLNISYFAPSHYRVFGAYTGESGWNGAVVPEVYSIIAASLNPSNGNESNGLVPAFSTNTGAADQCGSMGASNQKHWYQYDSCRTPFRIGIDACLNASADAKSYVAKTSSFFAPKGVTGIVDGYELDGTEKPEFPGGTYNGLSAAFIGPAGVGAMVPQSGKDYQSFIDDVYAHLIDTQNPMWTGGQYYDESWVVMSLLFMTGNYLDYTKY